MQATGDSSARGTGTAGQGLPTDRQIILAIAEGNKAFVEDLLANGMRANRLLVSASGVPFSPLQAACIMGQAAVSSLLITAQADVNFKDQDGRTPVYLASMQGHHQVVELLVRAKADVNLATNTGTSALYIASQAGHHKVVNLLIDATADVNHRAKNFATPLCIASQNGHIRVVQLLLRQRADVDCQINEGATPLYSAAQNGHLNVVKMLLQAQADVNLQANTGATPLSVASYLNHVEIVNLLIKAQAEFDLQTSAGDSPLYMATQNGHIEVMRLLIGAGADVNSRTKLGETPIYVASFNSHKAIVNELIQAGADINSQTQKGESPLYVASLHGNSQIVDSLVKANADVNLKNSSGSSPLFIASQNGHNGVVELLIKLNAEVNHQTCIGASPLYIACQNGHQTVVASLVSAQADVNAQRTSGESPLFIASCNGHHQVVDMLIRAQADVNQQESLGGSPLYIASQKGFHLVVASLLKAQADVDIQQIDGGTPIYIASQLGRHAVFKLLLKAQSNFNLQTDTGLSPLFIASQNGYHKLVDSLIEAQADVNIEDSEACTPVYIASQNGHYRVVESLIRAQADIGVKTVTGETPLLIASLNGHHRVAAMLVRASQALFGSQLGESEREEAEPEPAPSFVNSTGLESVPSDSELSQLLHSMLNQAGFVKARAALQAAVADVLQNIQRSRRESFGGIHIVGSYSEGWGNNLTKADGRTDSESDIDVMKLFQGRLYHIRGSCQCHCDEVEQVECKDGHIQCEGFASNPAKASSGTPLRPAVDEVDACGLCCYPPIAPLLSTRISSSNVPQSVLQSLRNELTNSPCHVVHAAPPRQAGKQLRVSTTFLEKRLLRSLSTLQGQLFVTLKYLVKKVISHKKCYNFDGLKAYHAKTITFRMLEETPAYDWRPENLVGLIRRALQMLLESIERNNSEDNADGRIMEHFFLSDAALYLKGVGPERASAMAQTIRLAVEVLGDVIEKLPQILVKFQSTLCPISKSGAFHFHPFQILPEPKLKSVRAEKSEVEYHEIYDIVGWSLLKLSQQASSPTAESRQALTEMIDRLPDCARSTREALRALIYLKFDDRDAALKVLSDCALHKVSRGITWSAEMSAIEATEEVVWQHLLKTDSAWKSCFRLSQRPELSFLPKIMAEYFPFDVDSYTRNAVFYVNFDALLNSLRLQLTPDDASARQWMQDVAQRKSPDVQELAMCAAYCDDSALVKKFMEKLDCQPVLNRLKHELRKKLFGDTV